MAKQMEVVAERKKRTQFRLARVDSSHPNWPAQVEQVRARISALANRLAPEPRVWESPIVRRRKAFPGVEFFTSSASLSKRWGDLQRQCGRREALINAYLEDLRRPVRAPDLAPSGAALAVVIQQAVEHGYSVILVPPESVEREPVVIRSARAEVERGLLYVSDQRDAALLLTEVNPREFARAAVRDW